jgi:hypothetical protein
MGQKKGDKKTGQARKITQTFFQKGPDMPETK